jgi:mannose/fructose-specific phosphotransferase system component IIA
MTEDRKVRGVVVAHGPMARAMIDAVRRIAGDAADALVPLSNDERGPDALKQELDRALGDDPVVVFTDLRSGSCGMAALSSCRDRGGRAVVCGVNLPMLLDFVFHRDLPLEELVDRMVERGRASITSPPLKT